MDDRVRAWLVPAVMVLLAGVIVAGLIAAPPREGDRTDTLAQQLRCPVCQGESVADSPSDTATAIRDQIDQMLAEGRSDQQILDHYVDRYGRWVLLDPPAHGDTLWLWLLPAAAAAAGLAVIVGRRRRDGPRSPLDDEDRAMLRHEAAALRDREDDQ